MSRPSRRQVQQPTPQYAAVPQSPRSNSQTSQPQPYIGGPRPVRSASASSNNRRSRQQQNERSAIAGGIPTFDTAIPITRGVVTGNIGAGYGPYSYHPQQATETVGRTNTRFSATPSENYAHPPEKRSAPGVLTTNTVPQYTWDKDPDIDDALHNPDPRGSSSFTLFSARGWVNASAIFLLIVSLITLFIGYPLILHLTHLPRPIVGFNLGGINASGQIPDLPGLPSLIDIDTPSSVLTRTGSDGNLYDLVFSDEFNIDGRTFYPGDDPYWEAVDLHYWPTGDLEWYDPSAVTTKDGKLVITMVEEQNHNLNFQSGMLTSWNKLCFTTGYIEVSVSLPGSPSAPGLWPAAWTLGNLGRAGYGATTEGMWPYTYDTCDLGTFPNQTARDGTPAAAATGGINGAQLSEQIGQKLSACTCPGSDHPGPSTSVGRGVPEIDIFEAQVDIAAGFQGQVSQSLQVAPYDLQYEYVTTSPISTIYNSSGTTFNTYKGGNLQEAVSAVTDVDSQFYGGNGYASYGFEVWSDPNNRQDGYVTWYSNGQESWRMTAATIGPNSLSQVSQRLVSEEPMYVIFNLGMAPSFQQQDFQHLVFPVSMYVDYIRIYQRRGISNGLTCNPPNRPTTDYINRHSEAYSNPNLTTWASANETFPRNSLYYGC